MIEDVQVIFEAHLKDPKGNVERRLATITEDRQQVERNPLEVPSPRPSEVVRNWPDKMWNSGSLKVENADGVTYCAVGSLYENSGEPWGEPDFSYSQPSSERSWQHDNIRISRATGLSPKQIGLLIRENDRWGKEAAADLLESWGL